MRKFLKKIYDPFLKKGLKLYYSKPRKFSYKGIEVLVHPDVFPPHLTLSTKLLLKFIDRMDLKGKTFLELGCGSGIISLYASERGAKVTASDINKIALEYLVDAKTKNNLEVEVCYSNMFENLKDKQFDIILINPPYYPKTPASVKEQAWYCGEDHNYFENLFFELPSYNTAENDLYMILSEDCDLKTIEEIALKNTLRLKLDITKKQSGEINYIFRIEAL